MIGQATSGFHNTREPQRSILGPVLFSQEVQPVGEVIRRHRVNFRHYADDIQLMLAFALNSTALLEALECLEACDSDWLTSSYLKLNELKSEFLLIVLLHPPSLYQPDKQVHIKKDQRGSQCTSQIDYCNSLFYGTIDSITPVLRDLPVRKHAHVSLRTCLAPHAYQVCSAGNQLLARPRARFKVWKQVT